MISLKPVLNPMLAVGFLFASCRADAVNLEFESAWATPTFALAKMGAGYFTLKNKTDTDIVITGLSIPKDVANKAELHETYMENDMAKMRHLEMPFVVKSNTSIECVPRGKHLMIMGLKRPLEVGSSFALTFELDTGESQTVTIPVQEKAGAKGDDHSHHHHH